MESMVTMTATEKFMPVLSKKDKQEMLMFLSVYEKYAAGLAEKNKNSEKETIFGKNNKTFGELLKEALNTNNWQPFIEQMSARGILLAQKGISFNGWIEMLTIEKRNITPYLQQEFGNDTLFISSVNGMNHFMDLSTGMLGEAYMHAKEGNYIQETASAYTHSENKISESLIQKRNRDLEQKVKADAIQMESLNKELTTLTYSISHDLRAPLRAVNGYGEMLLEDFETKLGEDGKHIIESIRYNIKKMGKLIDELLSFSRIGRKEINPTKIALNELAEGVMADINKSMIHHAEIRITCLHEITADYGLLHLALFNLISNAIKFSSKNENPLVEISSKLQNEEVIVSIKDNGVGFNMQYNDKLFNIFQRLHTNEDFEGAGVGLAIVQRVITRHEGKVWADGKINQGATFYIALKV